MKTIYLEPEKCSYEGSRLWCEDNATCDNCGAEWIEYTLKYETDKEIFKLQETAYNREEDLLCKIEDKNKEIAELKVRIRTQNEIIGKQAIDIDYYKKFSFEEADNQ